MKTFFLIVVADQEGDADWQIRADIVKAIVVARMMQETAFEKPKIWEVNADNFEAVEREWQ
jgi:hypothetical protein